MTKEELKEHCKRQVECCEMWARNNGGKPHGKVYEEHKLVLDLINTLEQSGEDCASREQALLALTGTNLGEKSADELIALFDKRMRALPPVTHTQRWIPVSERLPEEETDVLICNANKEIAISRGSYSTEIENAFIWYTSGWRFGEVIAWQPLPKPYEGEKND